MEDRVKALKSMKICRFCLTEDSPLSSIYEKRSHEVPLPLQIMSCVAIEAFNGDGMPQKICTSCRDQAERAYTFKNNCKKADDALRVYLATGLFTKPNMIPLTMTPITQKSQASSKTINMKASTPKVNAPPEMITLNFKQNSVSFAGSNDSSMDSVVQEEYEIDDSEMFPNEDSGGTLHVDIDPESEDIITKPSTTALLPSKGSFVNNNTEITTKFDYSPSNRSFSLKRMLSANEPFQTYKIDKNGVRVPVTSNGNANTGSRLYPCDSCSYSFTKLSLLEKHRSKAHNDEFCCVECGSRFESAADLEYHLYSVHRKKQYYPCRECSKVFGFKRALLRHQQQAHASSTLKPHKCNYCEASFTSYVKLMRHVTTHAGMRPYRCGLCGRSFMMSHHLARHMRSHVLAKSNFDPQQLNQYKCDLCSMSFRRRNSLINHSAIHSMVNLKCVICNRVFDNASEVKNHIASHLSHLPHACSKCDYSFETKEQLNNHEVKHAEIEYENQIEQEVIAEERKKQKTSVWNSGHMDGVQWLNESSLYQSDDSQDVSDFAVSAHSEVLRRSKRENAVKNFSQFLRDTELIPYDDGDLDVKPIARNSLDPLDTGAEMMDDVQDDFEVVEHKPGQYIMKTEQSDLPVEHVEMTLEASINGEPILKPVHRTESSKVYGRKGTITAKQLKLVQPQIVAPPPASSPAQPPATVHSTPVPQPPASPPVTLNQVSASSSRLPSPQPTKQDQKAVQNGQQSSSVTKKEVFNMKIGTKTVMVQKLVLTKDQFKAMAKEGKLEKRGKTVLLKKDTLKELNLDNDGNNVSAVAKITSITIPTTDALEKTIAHNN